MIVTAGAVRRASETSLQARMPAALALIGGQRDTTLPAVASWVRMADFLDLEDHDSPAVTLTSPGLDGPPTRSEDGGWRGRWLIRAYVVVRGRTFEETSDRVADYVAALRVGLLADPTLSGLSVGVEWRAENQKELGRAGREQRTIQAGSVTVAYECPTDLGALGATVASTAVTVAPLPPPTSFLPVHPALQ